MIDKIIDTIHDLEMITLCKDSSLNISLEYLVPTLLSNNELANDLIKFYTDLSETYKEYIGYYTYTDDQGRVKRINIANNRKFIKKHEVRYKKWFREITKKNLGISLDFEFLTNSINAYFTVSNFVDFFKLKKEEDLIAFGKPKNYQKIVELLNDGIKFDYEIGKFKDNIYIESLEPVICIGLPLMCLGPEYMAKPENFKMYDLTPKELTAITLHEIGHFLFYATGGIFGGYTGINLSMISMKLVKRLNKYKTNPKQLMKFGDELASDVHDGLKLLEPFKSDSVIQNFIKSAQKLLSKYRESKNLRSETKLIIYYLIILLLFILFLPVIIVIDIIQRLYLFYTGYIHTAHLYDRKSRQLPTSQMYYMNERFADEFVTRFNMNGYLASGLAKLYAVPVLGDDIKNNKKYLNQLYATGYVTNAITSLLTNVSLTKDSLAYTGIYEKILDRFNRMLENTRAILKADDIDETTKKIAFNQTITIKNIIKKFQYKYGSIYTSEYFDNNIIIKCIEFIDNFIPGSALHTSMEIKEYTRLYNKLDALINNSLFESSYILRSLAEEIE